MVEVPEYLLARSRKRLAELTGRDDSAATSADATDASTASAASEPAGALKAAVAPSVPSSGGVASPPQASPPSSVPPPKPDPPHVQVAKTRKKMPAWAAFVMACLPIWSVFYVGTLEPPSTEELLLQSNGAEVFSTCASCHSRDGAGTATGRQLNDGEVLLTFPDKEGFNGLAHQLSWTYLGTQGYRDLGLTHYGDPERPDGQREVGGFASGMSGFSNLSLDDLVSVVYYERVTHGGLDPGQATFEEELLLALAADHPTFETGSPEEIAELLAASAEAHGIPTVFAGAENG